MMDQPAHQRPDDRVSILPAGTMTFLVVDLDPSLRQDRVPGSRPWVLPRFHAAADAALAAHGGRRCVSRTDERVSAVFGSAAEALGAAAQFRPTDGLETSSQQLTPLLRIALHTGGA